METPTHGILEDIGAEIGFTATTALASWFAGQKLWVPVNFSASHPLCKIIGEKATLLLVKAFAGQTMTIPLFHPYSLRDRRIVGLVLAGKTDKQIAVSLRITPRRVMQLKDRLEKAGLLEDPAVLAGKIAGENAREKPQGKAPREMPGVFALDDGSTLIDLTPTPMRKTTALGRQVAVLLEPPRKRS